MKIGMSLAPGGGFGENDDEDPIAMEQDAITGDLEAFPSQPASPTPKTFSQELDEAIDKALEWMAAQHSGTAASWNKHLQTVITRILQSQSVPAD